MTESLSGLDTPEACLRYVCRVCAELDEIEGNYDAFRRQAEAAGDEAALVQAHVQMSGLRDATWSLTCEVMTRRARLKAEAQQRADD